MTTSRIDPICGMSGEIERHGHWFCSPACIATYKARHGLAGPRLAWAWRRDRVIWAAALVAGTLLAARLIPAAQPVADALRAYLHDVGGAVAIGLVIGGIIDYTIPNEYISRILAGRRGRTVVAAAGLGVLASACSHGVLALSMELHRKGASVPAVITFLLASPWASLPVTFLLVRLMGWMGLLVVAAAIVVAMVTGLIFQRLAHRQLIDANPHTVAVAAEFSIWRDLQARVSRHRWTVDTLWTDLVGMARGTWRLSQMVIWWVSIGLVMSSMLSGWVPAHVMQRYFGATWLGLLATMALATVLEVCSEGTAPLACELYRQTGALGNAFAFLMGGVVTDYTELALVWSNIGRRTACWMVLVTLPQVFVIGSLMNLATR